MTYRARWRWLRRLRMAWGALVQPTRLLDEPLWARQERLARVKEEGEMRTLTHRLVKPGTFVHGQTPVSDALAHFERLKLELAKIGEDHRREGGTASQICARMELANIQAGWRPGQ